ncbi:TetR/AcrR family transcriptional regulator [Nocardioides lianchengensis]|uniref:Regulatory protein, tetR family n=1 Tax=Nocardioides lianchengensis TaxID=1045774 RepID=A0A1G6I0Y9_9ACTN|nr:TetR/AcrR family transcriptional regulator [Nocardioides lianchengensis]NYG13222.1 AcrR family transcriptional regulator [Nocardioides lianchengensis]SDB99725.1 regulatory protein, tetR family [Nocardioides lianchengensis]
MSLHSVEPAPRRRVPTQARSRRRVEGVLDAAAAVVLEHGVAALTTREIARVSGMPVASLYQYFADKEEVLLALVERDMAEMDEQVLADLAALPEEDRTIAGIVGATMAAFVKVYDRRPAFVEVYLRGRTNAAVAQFGRDHNARVARTLREYAADLGLVRPSLTDPLVELAVEVGDRVFQLAYERRSGGDRALVAEGVAMVTAYLERYAA